MSDRLGTLLKEAADDSLGDARLQPPTDLPEARSGRRRTWLAAAAAVLLALGGLGAWALGSGAPTVDVETPPAQQSPSPESTPQSSEAARSALVSAVKRTMAERWEAVLHVDGRRPDDVAYQPPDRYRMIQSTGDVWLAIGDRQWETRNGVLVEFPSDEFVNEFAVLMAALGDPYSAHSVEEMEGLEALEGALIAEVDAAACAADQGPVPIEGETCEVQLRLESGRVRGIWIEPLRFAGGPNPYIEERVQLTFSVPSSTVPDIVPPDELEQVTTVAPPAPTVYGTDPANWPGREGPMLIEAFYPGTPIGEIGGLPETLEFLGIDYDLDAPMPSADIHNTVVLESDGYLAIRLNAVGSGFEIRDVDYLRNGMDHSQPAEWQSGRSFGTQEGQLDLGGCGTPRADLAVRYGDVEVREVWTDRPCPASLEIERPLDQPGWIIERFGPEDDYTMVEAYILPPGSSGAG